MVAVKVTISRYVDDSQPGWVECILKDARGSEWLFIEKVPVVSDAHLDSRSHYPQPGVIACRLVGSQQADGREIVTIDTSMPWGVESTTGEVRFDVFPEQLIEFILS